MTESEVAGLFRALSELSREVGELKTAVEAFIENHDKNAETSKEQRAATCPYAQLLTQLKWFMRGGLALGGLTVTVLVAPWVKSTLETIAVHVFGR